MVPTISLQELRDMPEFQACLVSLEAYRLALKTFQAWSYIRDEHDERTRDWPMIRELEGLKAEEQMQILRAQADMQRAFVHLVESLVRLLEPEME